MEIRKSSEDYLETMLMLKEQNGYVRSIDIAKHLNVNPDDKAERFLRYQTASGERLY